LERLRLLESVAIHSNDAVVITRAARIDEPALPAGVDENALAALENFGEAQRGGNGEELVFGVVRPILQPLRLDAGELRARAQLREREILQLGAPGHRQDFDTGRRGSAPASGVKARATQLGRKVQAETLETAYYAVHSRRQ